MKYLSFILLLLCSLQSFGQDPQLLVNTWYLHELVLNGESNPAPANADLNFIDLNFLNTTNENFISFSCSSLFGDITYDDTNSSFLFSLLSIVDLGCGFQQNQDFDTLYVDFYDTEQDFPFIYEITSSSGTLTLTITSESGNYAVYRDEILNINDNSFVDIAVYPNPVLDKLSFSIQNVEIVDIKLYTLEGKEIRNIEIVKDDRNYSMNLERLNTGIYFLKIKSINGQVTKPLIKR